MFFVEFCVFCRIYVFIGIYILCPISEYYKLCPISHYSEIAHKNISREIYKSPKISRDFETAKKSPAIDMHRDSITMHAYQFTMNVSDLPLQ